MHRVCSSEDKNLDTLKNTGAMGGRLEHGTFERVVEGSFLVFVGWRCCSPWRSNRTLYNPDKSLATSMRHVLEDVALVGVTRWPLGYVYMNIIHLDMHPFLKRRSCPVKNLPTVPSGRNLADRTANWWTLFTAAATLHRRSSWSMECKDLWLVLERDKWTEMGESKFPSSSRNNKLLLGA